MTDATPVRFALIADGPSDEALLQPLTWAFRQRDPQRELLSPIFWARRPPGADLNGFVESVRADHRPQLLFVHRDAERDTPEDRRREIPTGPGIIPVIPVRMTEAWLLIDEQAIRKASGNPNGRIALDLPKLQRLESIPDPKRMLVELLVRASGFTGRRRQQFQSAGAAKRVAENITAFTPLRALSAFQTLERDLAAVWPPHDE
jgi:hypothetical protein